VGGLILHLASWPVIFWLLVAIGLLTIPALHLLPETLPREKRTRQSLGDTLVAYGQLLRHRRLMGYASIVGSFYGGMYAYIAGTPFAYISYHHVAPQHYGVLFAVGIVGIMATNQVNARLVGRLGLDRLMRFGASAAAGSGTLLALDAYTGWGGLWGLALPLFVFVSATGFIVANAITGALGCSPERAGAASALLGMFQYGTGILGSALVGYFADGTPRPMAFIIAFFGFGSLLGALCLRPLRRDGPPTTYSAPATGPKD
jgi:DHA1 family bicyclomycin/chloramphenicol resistance-like MFS transporter